MSLINIHSQDVSAVLPRLLRDMTTCKNILFATDSYVDGGYCEADKITVDALNAVGLKPRCEKRDAEHKSGTKKKAEVFTSAKLVKSMIDAMENKNPVDDWMVYVENAFLEITCGEAPFLTTRYDAADGHKLPVNDRVGVLDRKLSIINQRAQWDAGHVIGLLMTALRSCYGYEWSGDSLVIARINVWLTFLEAWRGLALPDMDEDMTHYVTDIICWNLWQMDGLNGTVPITGEKCLVMNWASGTVETYPTPKLSACSKKKSSRRKK